MRVVLRCVVLLLCGVVGGRGRWGLRGLCGLRRGRRCLVRRVSWALCVCGVCLTGWLVILTSLSFGMGTICCSVVWEAWVPGVRGSTEWDVLTGVI